VHRPYCAKTKGGTCHDVAEDKEEAFHEIGEVPDQTQGGGHRFVALHPSDEDHVSACSVGTHEGNGSCLKCAAMSPCAEGV